MKAPKAFLPCDKGEEPARGDLGMAGEAAEVLRYQDWCMDTRERSHGDLDDGVEMHLCSPDLPKQAVVGQGL